MKGIIGWIGFKKRMGYQSVRVIARMFLNRIVAVIVMKRREERGLTRVRLTETRRKVTA